MNTPRVNLNSQKFKRATAALWYYNQDFSSEISEFVSDPLYTDPFRFKFVIPQKVIDGYNYFSNLQYDSFLDFYKALGSGKRQMLYKSVIRFCFACSHDTDVDIIPISTMRKYWQNHLLSGKVASKSKHVRMSEIRSQLERLGLIYRVTDRYSYSLRRMPDDDQKYIIDPEHTFSYMYVVNMHLVRLLLQVNSMMLEKNIKLAIDKSSLYINKPTITKPEEVYSDITESISERLENLDTDTANMYPTLDTEGMEERVFDKIDIFKKVGNKKPEIEYILMASLTDDQIINTLIVKYPFLTSVWKDVAFINDFLVKDGFENEPLTFKFNIERGTYIVDKKTNKRIQYVRKISIRATSSIVSYKAEASPTDPAYLHYRSEYLDNLGGKKFIETELSHWDRTASVPTTLKALKDGIVWDNSYDFYTKEIMDKTDIPLTRDEVKDVILPVLFDKGNAVLNKVRRERQKEFKTKLNQVYINLMSKTVADFDEVFEQETQRIKDELTVKYDTVKKPYYEKLISTVKGLVDQTLDTSINTKVFLYESIIYIKMRRAMYESGIHHISQVYDSFYFLDNNCPENINELFTKYALEVHDLFMNQRTMSANYNNVDKLSA